MKHYVIIENNSGFIWGDTLADNPEHACALICRGISGEPECEYEEVSRRFNFGDSGFFVFEVIGKLPKDYDGQDQEIIDMVGAWPLVTRVMATMKDDVE
jgi:hypothetical protein